MGSLKIAVVGGGAAVAGVLQGIERSAQPCEVTIFHPNQPLQLPVPTDITDDHDRPTEYFQALYRYLRHEHGFKFPPPKTLFGASPQRHGGLADGLLWDSTA